MADEIRTPGEGQIKLMVTGAGNPVLSTPNGQALDAALEEVTFMISLDPALNETTRHADLIFPPTSPLEHDHYDIAFHNLAIRNTARYNPAIFDKPEGAFHDWEIFSELGERLAERLDLAPMPRMAPDRLVDSALRAGPYGEQTEWQLSIEKLKAHPLVSTWGRLSHLALSGFKRRVSAFSWRSMRCLRTFTGWLTSSPSKQKCIV
jgi:anaerobic selenocysteine-containing dehydrogenase